MLTNKENRTYLKNKVAFCILVTIFYIHQLVRILISTSYKPSAYSWVFLLLGIILALYSFKIFSRLEKIAHLLIGISFITNWIKDMGDSFYLLPIAVLSLCLLMGGTVFLYSAYRIESGLSTILIKRKRLNVALLAIIFFVILFLPAIVLFLIGIFSR